MRYTYRIGDQIHILDLAQRGETFQASIHGEIYEVSLLRSNPDMVAFMLGDRPYVAHVATDGTRYWIFVDGETFILDPAVTSTSPGENGHPLHAGAGVESTIRAPMPGQVRAVHVKQGDKVEKGQTLLLLEAMKMEIRVQSPRAGHLGQLRVKTGETVERDQVLGEIE